MRKFFPAFAVRSRKRGPIQKWRVPVGNETARELQLTVESGALANYPASEFFPLPEEKVVVGHPKTERSADGKITFRVPIETQDRNVSALNGIVVFGQKENGPDRNAWLLTGTGSAPTVSASAPGCPAASPNFSSSVFSAGSFSI